MCEAPLAPRGLVFFPLFLLGSSLCSPRVSGWGGLGGQGQGGGWGETLVNMPRGVGHSYCHSGR